MLCNCTLLYGDTYILRLIWKIWCKQIWLLVTYTLTSSYEASSGSFALGKTLGAAGGAAPCFRRSDLMRSHRCGSTYGLKMACDVCNGMLCVSVVTVIKTGRYMHYWIIMKADCSCIRSKNPHPSLSQLFQLAGSALAQYEWVQCLDVCLRLLVVIWS